MSNDKENELDEFYEYDKLYALGYSKGFKDGYHNTLTVVWADFEHLEGFRDGYNDGYDIGRMSVDIVKE